MTTMTAMSTRFATEMVKTFHVRYEPGWFRSMARGAFPARARILTEASRLTRGTVRVATESLG
jgi:hypothetical protein